MKYSKIACNEDMCFYCGACENSCPDDLIKVNRKDLTINDPKNSGNFPWIKGWVNNMKEILRKRLISEEKEPLDIPVIEEEVKKVKGKDGIKKDNSEYLQNGNKTNLNNQKFDYQPNKTNNDYSTGLADE